MHSERSCCGDFARNLGWVAAQFVHIVAYPDGVGWTRIPDKTRGGGAHAAAPLCFGGDAGAAGGYHAHFSGETTGGACGSCGAR